MVVVTESKISTSGEDKKYQSPSSSEKKNKPDTFRYFFNEPSDITEKCIFCKIADGRIKPGGKDNPQELVFENERFVAFHDIHPGAELHLLIIPKEHLKNCWSLSSELLEEMDHIADQLVQENISSSDDEQEGGTSSKTADQNETRKVQCKQTTRFFIRPPWNSVYHVHMHVMSLPITEPWWSPRRIGFVNRWFHVTPDEVRKQWDDSPAAVNTSENK